MKNVLFACIQNAGRSQMAAAFFNVLADPQKAHAVSAGTRPAPHVHPEVVAAMKEISIDLSDALPRTIASVPLHFIDLLVTMGCGEDACPLAPGARSEEWQIEDPAGKAPDQVRSIRDAIAAYVEALVSREGWSRTKHAS